MRVYASLPLSERFWRHVDRGDDAECWRWLAYINPEGYGSFNLPKRSIGAHKMAYELVVGPVPDGLHLDHLCRSRWCVNPAHLEPVTCAENIRRGVGLSAQNARKTHCKRGHPFDETNTVPPKPYDRAKRRCLTCRRAAAAAARWRNIEVVREQDRERYQRRKADVTGTVQ